MARVCLLTYTFGHGNVRNGEIRNELRIRNGFWVIRNGYVTLRYGHLVTQMSVTEKYVTSYVSVTGFGLSVTVTLRYVTDIWLRKCP